MRHIIDLSDLTDKEFNDLYKLTTNIIDRPEGYVDACRGKVLGSLFYEPSTRTNLSFSTAMMRLGGSVVGFSDPRSSSTTKGETLKDTINMVSCYADMIVMRNPREGAAKAASLYSSVPVINAGDGGHLHPTQTLADMVTILRMRGSADDMKIGLCGDLKYGRTVHSLLHFLERFHNVQVYLIAPDALKLPDYMITFLKEHNMPYCEVSSIDEVLPELDVLYMIKEGKHIIATSVADLEATTDDVVATINELHETGTTEMFHEMPFIFITKDNVDEYIASTEAYLKKN